MDRSMTEALRDEERRMRRLRLIVDSAAYRLKRGGLSKEEGQQLVEETRVRVLELFPDKGPAFDLIYRPRFQRILEEKTQGR